LDNQVYRSLEVVFIRETYPFQLRHVLVGGDLRKEVAEGFLEERVAEPGVDFDAGDDGEPSAVELLVGT